jgi:hypothetical protein
MKFKFKIRSISAKTFISFLTFQNEVYILGKFGSMNHSVPYKLSDNV